MRKIYGNEKLTSMQHSLFSEMYHHIDKQRTLIYQILDKLYEGSPVHLFELNAIHLFLIKALKEVLT